MLHLPFLVVGNPSSTNAGAAASDRRGFPIDGANPSSNWVLPIEGTQFLQEHKGSTQHFTCHSKRSHCIPRSSLANSCSCTSFIFWNICPLLLFSLQDKYVLVSATLWTCKQASKETLQVILLTQKPAFPWPCSFEPCIMAVWDSSSSNYFFSTSWSISLHWHASQQNLSDILPASRAEFIHV